MQKSEAECVEFFSALRFIAISRVKTEVVSNPGTDRDPETAERDMWQEDMPIL